MIEINSLLVVILMFGGIIVGLSLGHPIAFILGGIATIFAFLGWGPDALYIFTGRAFDAATNHILIAIANFILMASFLGKSGISERIFRSVMYLFGPMNGAIALAALAWCALEAAATGVIGASVVSMTILAMPVMLKYHYNKEIACGSIAAGGSLSILIPPSIMLVMMADQSGISVGRLFAAGVGPGLLLTVLFFIYIIIVSYLDPTKAPALPLKEREAISTGQKFKYLLVNLVPAVILITGVLGSIWTGIATPTEASGVGAFIAFIFMIFYEGFDWKVFFECLWSAARTNCMVMTIIIGASVFTSVFLGLGGGDVVNKAIYAFGFMGKWGMLGIMMFMVFMMGFIIDWIAIVYIVFPIFMPIAAELGFNPTWFIIMIAVNLQVSFLSPPVGYALFYMKTTVPPEVRLPDIYRGVVPFIVIQLISLIILWLYPPLATYLPGLVIE
ncbi:MAG: TRAP transporter large permease subunit [Deltaproteobacteria bacterium]|nr:TRAP transporter large permease subunit [Deltaproteobacteria bacterium]